MAHYCSIDTYPKVSTGTLFTITRELNQPRFVSVNKWVIKTKYIYIMEYYSVAMNNGIMESSGKLMEMDNIITSEVTQIQKNKCHFFSLIGEF